jgi:hypothetical protein
MRSKVTSPLQQTSNNLTQTRIITMANSQPPTSPFPEWSAYNQAPASPISPYANNYQQPPAAPPLSPASPYSTSSSASAPWSPSSSISNGSSAYSQPTQAYATYPQPMSQAYETYQQPTSPPQQVAYPEMEQASFMDRSSVDQTRLRGAKSKSLALLNMYAESSPQNVAVEEATKLALPSRETAQQAAMLRKAAIRRHKIKRMAQAQGIDVPDTPSIAEVVTKGKNLHKLATSTRPKKPQATPEEEDESMAGMKCQLDIEREGEAQRKALLLLDVMSMF